MHELDPERVTLGQVSVNREAFDLDLKIGEQYQAYSAELLRLALLVLTGLSAVWLKVYLSSEPGRKHFGSGTGGLFMCAFASAALSAGTALLHRYTAADALAYQLTALRRRARKRPARPGTPSTKARPSDIDLAEKQERTRDLLFKWSSRLLGASAALLFLGVLLFCLSLAAFMV